MTEFVFDLEADGWRDQATRVWCVCITDVNDRHEGVLQYRPDEIDEALAMLDKADHLIGHNILNYDLPLLERLHGWKPRPDVKITDTVILSRLFKSDRKLPAGAPGNFTPHGLGAWGYRVGRGKPDHEDWSQFTEEMLHRCSEDAEINALVYWQLMEEGKDFDWKDSIQTEHDIAVHITQQEINGVPLRLDTVRSLSAQLEREIEELDRAIVPRIPEVPLPRTKQGTWPKKQFKKDGQPTAHAIRYYGEGHSEYRTDLVVKTAPINLASDAQVKQYLLSIGWVPTEWNYKKDPETGKPMRDALGQRQRTSPKLTLDSLESCRWPEGSEEMGEGIVRRLMLAHRSSMLKGWLRDVRPDGRISALAVPMGTPTGRMTHRQVVNVPGNEAPLGTELRGCYGSVMGYTRVGIDLQSCQIFALCHYMPDERYREAARNGTKEDGTDTHSVVQKLAALLTRQQGKKFHYSILFGAGDEKLANDLGMSMAEVKRARKLFFTNLALLDKLIKALEIEWAQNGGWIRGLDGRKVWVRAKHMLLVYLLQSMEAIIMKNFINKLLELADWQHLAYELVTTMHDECQFLVRDDHVTAFKESAHAAIKAVNAKFNLEFDQEIDIETGETWAECH